MSNPLTNNNFRIYCPPVVCQQRDLYQDEYKNESIILTPHDNFIWLHESFASKKPLIVILQLPSYYDSNLYKGRVYQLQISWSFFDCELLYDPVKQNDITNPQTAQLFQNFVFDSTWKYKIEPFDPTAPQPHSIIISPTFTYQLLQTIDGEQNRIIYEIPLPTNYYIIVRMDIELSSVYPNVQKPDNLSVTVIRQ